MYFDGEGVKTERKRGEGKRGRVDKERERKRGEVDEAGSRESSNDGSDRRATCQTLEVISCFVEDFYGILAAWLTSRRERRDGERQTSLPSSSSPPPLLLTRFPSHFLLHPVHRPSAVFSLRLSRARYKQGCLPKCTRKPTFSCPIANETCLYRLDSAWS